MNKNYLLFLWSFFISFIVSAQEFSVSGKIVDGVQNPISYATVVVRSLDSVLLKGTSTNEDGSFTIEKLKKGKYYISASYIGNYSSFVAINMDSNIVIDPITIPLIEQNLDEVIVTLQKPRLERQADRLVYNIANTALTDSDVWDVLKKTPSVLISGDKIQIKGEDKIGVMINGRKINLPKEDIFNFLSGTSASNVESIEVITNPPLKYSAEGGMLINIVMRKKLSEGYNGAIYGTYKQGVFAKNTLGTDHYFKGNKTDFSINYALTKDKKTTKFTDITNFFENDIPNSIWTANQESIHKQNKHLISLYFDYYLNDKNHISLYSLNTITPKEDRFVTSKTRIEEEGDNSSFNTFIPGNQNKLNTSYYLDWIHKLRKKGEEISFGSHYTFYDATINQNLSTDFFNSEEELIGENNFNTDFFQKINLYNAQIDYITPIGKKAGIESGIRYAGIESKNTIKQEGFDRNQPGINPTEDGTFSYDEDIFAAYSSFNTKWSNFKLNTGLRAEYTETIGFLNTTGIKNKKSYLELFPSFSLNYLPSKKNNLRLYYYRRINRPRYNKINPFQYFQNNNSVIEGNPNLLPATRNYLALEYVYDKTYAVEVFYRNEKNQYREQVFQDNDSNLLRYLSYNINSNISYGIDVSFNKNITSYWDTYVLFSVMNKENEFIDFGSNELIENSLPYYVARFRNSFTLLTDKSLMADVNFRYYSPLILGNNRYSSINSLDIDLRKTLWNKKASISLGVSDIFRQSNDFSSRIYADQNNTTYTRRENRLFKFSFRYKFGNEKIKSNKKTKRNAERGRI